VGENPDITQIANLIQDFGIWILFAWLYVQEKKAHNDTRVQYREDLREIAGMRQSMTRVQQSVNDFNSD
jgi:hypothetical protein